MIEKVVKYKFDIGDEVLIKKQGCLVCVGLMKIAHRKVTMARGDWIPHKYYSGQFQVFGRDAGGRSDLDETKTYWEFYAKESWLARVTRAMPEIV